MSLLYHYNGELFEYEEIQMGTSDRDTFAMLLKARADICLKSNNFIFVIHYHRYVF